MMPSWCRQVEWGHCRIAWVNCAVLCVKDDWKWQFWGLRYCLSKQRSLTSFFRQVWRHTFASWNKLSYSPLTQVRVLSYRTPCHKPFHLAITFKPARNNKTIRIDTTLINNTKAFFIVNNCCVYLFVFLLLQPTNAQLYHKSISLCNTYFYMFQNFYVIVREFYLCALLRYVNS